MYNNVKVTFKICGFTITSCYFGILTSLPIITLHLSPDKALGCALFAVAFTDVTLSFYLLTGWNSFLLRQIWWGLGYSYSFLSLFSGRSPNMTEIFLTGTLSLNSINQINIFLKIKSITYSYLSILAAVLGFVNLS